MPLAAPCLCLAAEQEQWEFGNKPSRAGGEPQDLKQEKSHFLLEFQRPEQQTNNYFPVPLLGRSIIPERGEQCCKHELLAGGLLG